MIILRLLLLLTNLHLKLLSTQGTGADKLLSTQTVKHSDPFGIIHLLSVFQPFLILIVNWQDSRLSITPIVAENE